MKTNLYWPVYKNLEAEIIILSNQIHFDDNQLNIYSIKIAELILRICVEVESISKALYFSHGGEKPDDNILFYDTDCLDYLENKFTLSKKNVLITSSSFYLEKLENKVLTPLNKANKRGTSQTQWQQAYQAIKHNRVTSLKKAKLGHLINSMAALYLLNIYYKDAVYDLGKNSAGSNFDESLGSSIYSIKIHNPRAFPSGSNYIKQPDFDSCTYLIKYEDQSRLNIKKVSDQMQIEANMKKIELLSEESKVKKTQELILAGENLNDVEQLLKAWSIRINTECNLMSARKHSDSLISLLDEAGYEAVLNRNQY
jgi:hypothetical protein